MEELTKLASNILSLPTESHLFIVSVFALSLTGFALYVVLTALRSGSRKGDEE